MKKPINIMSLVDELSKGKTVKQLEKELEDHDKTVAQESGKTFGECESCGMDTVLVEEVGLCGPCCFGEADTMHGQW